MTSCISMGANTNEFTATAKNCAATIAIMTSAYRWTLERDFG
jgi:hypothetical protein